MNRDITEIVREFRQFTADDFDYSKGGSGPEQLYALCEEVEGLPDPTAVFPEFFALMERLPDSELGTPGPLVHTLENHIGSYERLLAASVRRKPTDLSVWMVNRILNGSEKDRAFWIELLALAADHPEASEVIKDEAKRFIQLQSQK
ncbi:hypothetical protein JIN85_20010 [Luteolibacter pohnpeiensis]|uniref:Uncharacterized protein n=1 Tax=Luteolibacter pohnpeiensis TaxID=454153 RepID=A0A934VWK5_9BACT|nr:hypothetical protein [Luteolibacter pohnpeiensis]MBK1884707.1 hypothetical protein [Luteolibacter pohnpeiensis]